MKPTIEVILPVFNEEENIPLIVKELSTVAKRIGNEAELKILFVNDGSSDRTSEILKQLFAERSDIRIVNLLHNFGHSAAIAAGLKHFQGDIAILMDADFQDNPHAITEMFAAWRAGARTVVAERGSRKEKSRFLFHGFYFLLNRLAPSLPPVNFGTYCLLDQTVVKRMNKLDERVRYFPGLVALCSDKITPIKVDRNARAHGSSRVGFFGLIQLAITAFVSFSSSPIKFVSVMGLMCSLASVSSGLLIVGIKLFSALAIPGWASQMTAIAFGSGIQLLCLGIIGEYIARIYDEVKKRPLYVVDEVIESKKASTPKYRYEVATPRASEA